MGFSALDGMPMGTRSGQLDPGVILHLLDRGMSADDITTLLYKESGLKGLSGLSHDMRTLLASDMKGRAEAIDYYTFRLGREIGAMAAVLGGLDALVFTGGIGENAPEIRARGLDTLAFLGLALDPGPTRQRPPHRRGLRPDPRPAHRRGTHHRTRHRRRARLSLLHLSPNTAGGRRRRGAAPPSHLSHGRHVLCFITAQAGGPP
jgi:hypothetical protein